MVKNSDFGHFGPTVHQTPLKRGRILDGVGAWFSWIVCFGDSAPPFGGVWCTVGPKSPKSPFLAIPKRPKMVKMAIFGHFGPTVYQNPHFLGGVLDKTAKWPIWGTVHSWPKTPLKLVFLGWFWPKMTKIPKNGCFWGFLGQLCTKPPKYGLWQKCWLYRRG